MRRLLRGGGWSSDPVQKIMKFPDFLLFFLGSNLMQITYIYIYGNFEGFLVNNAVFGLVI